MPGWRKPRKSSETLEANTTVVRELAEALANAFNAYQANHKVTRTEGALAVYFFQYETMRDE